MILLENGGLLVQSASELPSLASCKEFFGDVETTAFDPKTVAFNPWKGHRICGMCVAVDDDPRAWYVPVRHNYGQNVPLDATIKWLDDILASGCDWINHNVKFDAHFLAADGVQFPNNRLIDTLTFAKIIDSDRGYAGHTYSLDSLSLDWLERDITPYEKRIHAVLRAMNSKNYADIPVDIMGPYGAQDALSTRALYRYCQRRLPAECKRIWELEIKLTPVLYDMEATGMVVDPTMLRVKKLTLLGQMLAIEEELDELAGYAIRPHTTKDCFQLLCGKYGLPVIERTAKGEPSFDKSALLAYTEFPAVASNPELAHVIELISKYRKMHTLVGMFIDPFLEYEQAEVMHSNYNQAVRTGRMSCSRPNAQQNSKESKALILPGDGEGILTFDLSQIEFRLIVHYINAIDAIAAYAKDPNTDFHAWVAEINGIPRRPAKTINFRTAYGGGQAGAVEALKRIPEFVESISGEIDALIANGKLTDDRRMQAYDALAERKAVDAYQRYHDSLPTLRQTARRAEYTARARGYVYTAYGRRRHLSPQFAHKAFNSVMQGTAADIAKDIVVATAQRYNKRIRESGIRQFAVVHDEIVFRGPVESTRDPELRRYILSLLESPEVKFRVPIRADAGYSEANWAIASGDAGKITIER